MALFSGETAVSVDDAVVIGVEALLIEEAVVIGGKTEMIVEEAVLFGGHVVPVGKRWSAAADLILSFPR